MPRLPVLNLGDLHFPNPEDAFTSPNGLLAEGGDLRTERLIAAYSQGIFPWYSPGDPILWWSPNPRVVLFPEKIHINRSLKKTLRHHPFDLSFDQDFEQVVAACAAPREAEDGTWITTEMQKAYLALFQQGMAHSVEVRHNGVLVGGLYGVAIGAAFFGESMFSRESNASKVALVTLARELEAWGFHFIDCQFSTPHLLKMGAESIARTAYLAKLRVAVATPPKQEKWVVSNSVLI